MARTQGWGPESPRISGTYLSSWPRASVRSIATQLVAWRLQHLSCPTATEIHVGLGFPLFVDLPEYR